MPAGVAAGFTFNRFSVGHGGLRNPGQGVELPHDANHRRTAAESRGKSRWDAANACADLKASLSEGALQEPAGLGLEVTQLGPLPQLVCHGSDCLCVRADPRECSLCRAFAAANCTQRVRREPGTE